MATGALQETEEDAVYITNKRFQEHYEEQNRLVEKQARQEAKENSSELKGK
jgi:hypothetical protein